jgi:glycosyltransferase involved in cell wall biosynthesis
VRDSAPLEADLARQTVAPGAIEVVRGVAPTGRARNLGVARTRAEIIVFIDDDARLHDPETLARLLAPLDRDPAIGVSGAAKVLPARATRFERRVAREVPRVVRDVVDRDVETNPAVDGYGFSDVTTTCCAIRRAALDQAGGFREDIARGTDTELFRRVRAHGWRFVLAANAAAEHPAPRDLGALLARFRELGNGHAREAALDPSRRIGPRITTRAGAVAYLAARAVYLPANVIVPWSRAHPVLALEARPLKALASFAAAVGYVEGSLAAARGEPAA